ncbi:glycosyltransferase family 2 protein [Salinibacterium sp. M195]|uniref:glycosyltransferase n=1 Tax=Salinibacterium sp. M195 TaxID=2583374 RepID=UPI001C62CA41|nr:glycosyltransferase family 2 protein [Salinibacterium sp. M195]QYH36957.1 glycosyltransferase family 2 protein [Salinibacterium sp. M195]
MTSVVIAAHNEEALIGACLDALRKQTGLAAPLEIVVSANACTDATADIAHARQAVVVDRPQPGKAAALNAGEQVVHGYPRIYLDADIVVPENAVADVIAALHRTPGALAAVPRRRVNTVGRPWAVRSYFAINERLPAFTAGLFGRGMITLSAEGRARFDTFPEMVADDLFLDSLFLAQEKVSVPTVEVTVESPFTLDDLMRRLIRVRRGNSEMREAARSGDLDVSVRRSDKGAWLRIVAREPRLAIAAIPYLVITMTAARRARRPASSSEWGRDESTRSRPAMTGEDSG